MDSTTLPRDAIVVRHLTPADQEAVIAIDARILGRRREEFFRLKLRQSFADTGIAVSLGAEIDRAVVGFLLARVYYGEFGTMEPVAVLDTLGVHPDTRGVGIGHALMEQLLINLAGLGVPTLRTEVAWEDTQLLAFFQRERFRPAARLCLELPVTHRP